MSENLRIDALLFASGLAEEGKIEVDAVVPTAQAFYAFLSEGGEAPKAEKPKRRSATSTSTPPSEPSSEKEPEPSQPTSTESSSETSAKPAKEEKKATITKEQARAALVEVQTVLGHKDHAMLIVQKFSTDGFNSIPAEKYPELVAAAKAKIAEFNASK